ncbi:MAG: hypothetical protein ACREBH_04465 [Candidatus Micrarchaeaceae archaeon]
MMYAISLVARYGITFSFYDAISHNYISLVAWQNFNNLAGIWLPLQHILLMPLTLIPFLYKTGLDGAIVNSIFTALTCVVFYKIYPKKYVIPVIMIFALNIYTLSFSAMPMQEPIAIFFGVFAIYYFFEYLKTDKRHNIIKMSLVLAVGSLVRYEIWALALILVVMYSIREISRKRTYNVAFSYLAFIGVIIWLFWELLIFHDPLYFLHPVIGLALGNNGPSGANIALAGSFTLSNSNNFRYVYEVLSIILPTIYLYLLRKRNRMQTITLSMIVITLLIFTIVYQLPLINKGIEPTGVTYLYFVHTINSYKPVSQKIGKYSVLLLSTNIGTGGAQILSLLVNDPKQMIDEYSSREAFINVSIDPSRVNYVVITPLNSISTNVNVENNFYNGHFFLYDYYYNQTWRNAFLANFTPVLSNSNFTVYENKNLLTNTISTNNTNSLQQLVNTSSPDNSLASSQLTSQGLYGSNTDPIIFGNWAVDIGNVYGAQSWGLDKYYGNPTDNNSMYFTSQNDALNWLQSNGYNTTEVVVNLQHPFR